MNLFQFKVQKDQKFFEIKKQYFTILDKAHQWSKSIKPHAEERFPQTTTDDYALIPILPLTDDYLNNLALHCDILRIGLNTKRSGIFRRGTRIVTLYDNPNPLQEVKLKSLLTSCNENGQKLIDVCKQVQWDDDVHDNGYYLVLKDYYFNSYGKIIDGMTKAKEVIRANPTRMKLIANEQGTL
jgi:hypothetical protein